MPDGEWLTAEELRADPIMCEHCRKRAADYHGADGWICDGCVSELHPRYEG